MESSNYLKIYFVYAPLIKNNLDISLDLRFVPINTPLYLAFESKQQKGYLPIIFFFPTNITFFFQYKQ